LELPMIYKISPFPSLPSLRAGWLSEPEAGPEALWAGGQRGEKKGKMTHSITRRANLIRLSDFGGNPKIIPENTTIPF